MKEKILLAGLFLAILTTFTIVLIVETSSSGSTSTIDKYSYSSEGPLRFHLVGDFGELRKDKKLADGYWAVEHVAAKMKEVADTRPIGFIMTAGDNRYQDVNDEFDEKIFKMMHNLFDDGSLAMKPWYVTLGNHDCISGVKYELEMEDLYPMWNLPKPYYKIEQSIDNGKKVGIIVLNACDLACENYEKYENQKDMCEEFDHIADQEEIDEQYDWLNSTLYNYSQDPTISWTIVSIHTAPYTGGSGDGDVENLKLRLIPMLQDYKVDVLLTGHDHLMQHFYIPNKSSTKTAQVSSYSPSPLTDDCVLPYYLDGQTSSISQKGEGLHQVIMGASGRELEDFCPQAYSEDATLLFGDVEYGFLELYVDSSKINLKYHAINVTDPVYEVTVVNYSSVITLEFEVFGKVQGVSFRKYTMNKAKELGITGWVKNTDRGTVVGTIQGPSKVIEHMKQWLAQEGSPHSEISKFVIHSQRFDQFSSYNDFEIKA